MRVLLMVVAGLVASVGCGSAQERINESIPTSATGEVTVSNVAGSVRVTAWDRNEISVTGTLGRGTERLDIERGDDRVEIRVVLPERTRRNVEGSDLEVRVPAGKDVGVGTVSAEVDVEGVRGLVEVETVSGGIDVSGSPREVEVESTSGRIRVEAEETRRISAENVSGTIQVRGSASEAVDAEAVSGNVDIQATTPEVNAGSVSGTVVVNGVRQSVEASTVSGTVRVMGRDLEHGSFESVSGTIRFEGSFERGASAEFNSHSGDVEIVLPAGTPMDVEVTTFSGDISNEFGQEAQRTNRFGPGRELNFSTGDDGVRITANTFSGAVKLLRQ